MKNVALEKEGRNIEIRQMKDYNAVIEAAEIERKGKIYPRVASITNSLPVLSSSPVGDLAVFPVLGFYDIFFLFLRDPSFL